jgi:hypothetical protein
MAGEFLGKSAVFTSSGSYDTARTGAYALPAGTSNRALVVVITATGPGNSNSPGDPEDWDVSYGGLPLAVRGLLVDAPGDDVPVAIAALSLDGVTPVGTTIEVDLSSAGFGPEVGVAFQAFVFENIRPADAALTHQFDTDDSPGDGSPTETVAVPETGDVVFTFTVGKFGASPTPALTFSSDGNSFTLEDATDLGDFTLTSGSDSYGARSAYTVSTFDAADTAAGFWTQEWDSSQSAAVLGTVSVVLRAVVSDTDTFNCDCEAESTYQTLGELRERMLVRCGYAAVKDNPPPGVADTMDEYLRSAQNFLYAQPANGSLRTERFYRWTMVAGERFYGLRANEDGCARSMDEYKVTWVGWEDLNGRWAPLTEGIPPELYTTVTQEGFPYRYEIRSCIEIFPAPQAAYTLRVKGHFGLEPFNSDSDRATIDSEAVFLLAVGNYLTDRDKPGATNALAQANAYVKAKVSGSHHTARYVPGPKGPPPMVQPRMVQFDDE